MSTVGGTVGLPGRPVPTRCRWRKLLKTRMTDLKKRFPPDLDYKIVYDTTLFINESIGEVFNMPRRRDPRGRGRTVPGKTGDPSTPSPFIAAVPVAIIGTFAVMAFMGFSLNNLTLFGLVLAVGIVVDDAIVVVEAVEHHIEHGMNPHDATVVAEWSKCPAQCWLSASVLSAVFIPVRVHHGHHRPILPAVRVDHRRLDGSASMFNSPSPQPSPLRPLYSSRARGGTRYEACRSLAAWCMVFGLKLGCSLGGNPHALDLLRGWSPAIASMRLLSPRRARMDCSSGPGASSAGS